MDPLLKYLVSRTRNRDDALDIMQNVFIKCVEISKTREIDPTHIEAFIFQIARHRQVDHYRKEEREQRYLHKTVDEREPEKTLIPPESSGLSPPDQKILNILEQGLEDPDLSERCREVLRLHLQGGQSGAEIALSLNVSRQTVQRDLQKGFRILRPYFEKEDLVPE